MYDIILSYNMYMFMTCMHMVFTCTYVPMHVQIINQVVLWDKIIKRGDPAAISASSIKSEYPFFDDGFGLL